ncbi:MAG: alpha/beta fold hydrolase [Acidimicrobiia bacterium]|nr:alpha/beta fold hydrolase [Acidimicrobiia bacterium]
MAVGAGSWLRAGGGDEGTVLLLLHGLGGTADLWEGVMDEAARRWPGPWLAPDLLGHGRSPRSSLYEPGQYAAAVSEAVAGRVGDAPIVALGHSLGGVIALTLATGWFGLDVVGVVGVGIKIAWSAEDLEDMAALRAKPVRHFATRKEAAERFLLVNGLRGLVDAGGPMCQGGVVEDEGGWRLAHDPASFPDFVPSMDDLVRLGHKPVVLARGERDEMVSAADIAAVGVEPTEIAGAGHNAHVERPGAVLDLVLGRG